MKPRRTLQDLGRASVPLDEVDALIVAGLFAASSDGEIADAEIEELVRDLGELAILEDLEEDERREEVARLRGLCEREGLGAMMGSALELLQESTRELAFSLSLRVLIADGVLPELEFQYLRELRGALELSDEQYDRLTQAAL